MSVQTSRAVVSGGFGFVGRRLVTRLENIGYSVSILTRSTALDLATATRCSISTALPADELIDRVCETQPSAIVHLASVGGATTSAAEFGEVLEANVELGAVLLEAAAQLSNARKVVPLVGAGSFWQRSATNGVIHPNSFYAASKDALEALARYYCAERGVVAVFLQLTDVYGPRDGRGRLLEALAEATRVGRPVDLTAGDQVVSFVHVDDVARAVEHAIDHASAIKPRRGLEPLAYSVRGPSVASLRDTIIELSREIGIDIPVKWGARPYRPNEVMAPELLDLPPGWMPHVSLADGFSGLLEGTI